MSFYVPLRPKGGGGFNFTPAQALVLGFLALIMVGSILLSLPISHAEGQHVSYLDALFTATSAVCVTGLTVLPTAATFSRFGQVVIILLVQAGGLGFMTVSTMTILLMGRKVGLKDRLMMQQALGSFSMAGVVRLTRNIVLVTFGIEAVGALLLTLRFAFDYPLPKALYFGVFHTISAFNNAGLDLTDESLEPFRKDPFILGVVATLVILGGLGFFLMEDVWRNRKWEKLTLHSKIALKVTVVLTVAAAVLFLLLEWNNPDTFGSLPWYHKIVNGIFAAVTPKTAGFASFHITDFMDTTLLIMMVLMIIGASPGGTGGGIKTTTAALIFLTVKAAINGKEQVEVMGRRIPKDQLDKAVTITTLSVLGILLATAILLVTETQALADPTLPTVTFIHVLFESVSAFATVGLSAGVSAHLSGLGKALTIVLMFIGRVGPMTMAVALAQRNKHNRSPIDYPEERVMIG